LHTFESLYIYKKANEFNLLVRSFLRGHNIDYPTENQLRRASLSIVLNIAEVSARMSDKDTRRFYIMSRSSVLESAAILILLNAENSIERKLYSNLYSKSESLSKMLYKMIRDLS
jgi:four helix bundle protein